MPSLLWAEFVMCRVDPTPLKIAHLFLIHGPVSPSRQQFSQNYSCIKPEDTILWHCKMIFLSEVAIPPAAVRVNIIYPAAG